MNVTILGGWETDETINQGWKLALDARNKDEIKEFCKALGRELARRKHTVFVGSDDQEKSVDPYVVEGMLEELSRRGAPESLIRPIHGIEPNRVLFEDRRKSELARFFLPYVPPRAERWPRAAAKIVAIREADVVIPIAGLQDTYIAGVAALVAQKRLVPVAVFGGASRELFYAAQSLGEGKLPREWHRLLESRLDEDFAKTVLRLGALERARVFFGYCSRAKGTAKEIRDYLTELGLEVEDWATDFQSGGEILSEIQAASHSCKYGLFLFTPDDAVKIGEKEVRIPRSNVVFEAGYFMNSHGPERTVIICQEGTEVLADLRGRIYIPLKDAEDISPIKEKLRKAFEDDLG